MKLKTPMYLNIKIITVISLFLSTITYSQDSTQVRVEKQPFNRKGLVNVGAYIPNAIGSNFVAKGMQPNAGLNLEVTGWIMPKIALGARYAIFGAGVVNPTFTGSYDNSTITIFGASAGYSVDLFRNTDILLKAGGGFVNYYSKKGDLDFNDGGGSMWLNPDLNYSIFKWLALSAGVELRADFLNIETAPQLKSDFNTVTYFNFITGLRFSL